MRTAGAGAAAVTAGADCGVIAVAGVAGAVAAGVPPAFRTRLRGGPVWRD